MNRIEQLTELTDYLSQLESQKRDVAMLHLYVISTEKALTENREKLEAAKEILNATLGRIDAGMLALYPVPTSIPASTLAPQEEKKPRGRKAKEQPEQKGYAEVKHVEDLNTPTPAPPKQGALAPCQNTACEYLDASTADNCGIPVDERHGLPIDKCSDYRAELPAIEEETHATVAPEAATETAEEVAADPGHAPAVYSPLAESLNDCELCMGYGVIEGELYGEVTLVPCTCEAGLKVKGGVVPSKCDDCNIENPDCASCHTPDMDAPLEVEEPAKCVNRNCTANDPTKNVICCLSIAPGQPCKSFVGVGELVAGPANSPPEKTTTFTGVLDSENLPWDQRIHFSPPVFDSTGKWAAKLGVSPLVVAKIKAEWRSVIGNTASAQEPAKPELTPLQQKCTHPKVFREQTPEGERCRACKLILSGGGQPGLFPAGA